MYGKLAQENLSAEGFIFLSVFFHSNSEIQILKPILHYKTTLKSFKRLIKNNRSHDVVASGKCEK